MSYLLYVFASAMGGLLVGVLGTGSSLILLPSLTLIFGATLPIDDPLRLAAGTTMATISVGAIAGAIAQYRAGQLDLRLFRLTLPPYVLGSLLGPWISRVLPTRVLGVYVAALICIVAVRMLIARPMKLDQARDYQAHRVEATLVFALIGVGCSLAGVASGVFAIPYMSRFSVPIRTTMGTSTASAAVYAAVGAAGYVGAGWAEPGLPPGHIGFVYVPAFATMAMTALIVTPIGVRLARHIDERVLRRLFAVFLLCAAAAMLYA